LLLEAIMLQPVCMLGCKIEKVEVVNVTFELALPCTVGVKDCATVLLLVALVLALPEMTGGNVCEEARVREADTLMGVELDPF